MPRLRIVFPKPGFFLTDIRCEVRLDGHSVYDGGFLQGFVVEGDCAPGPHQIETLLHLGVIARTKRYRVDVPPAGGVEVTLVYSRLWGNFKSRLITAQLPWESPAPR